MILSKNEKLISKSPLVKYHPAGSRTRLNLGISENETCGQSDMSYTSWEGILKVE